MEIRGTKCHCLVKLSTSSANLESFPCRFLNNRSSDQDQMLITVTTFRDLWSKQLRESYLLSGKKYLGTLPPAPTSPIPPHKIHWTLFMGASQWTRQQIKMKWYSSTICTQFIYIYSGKAILKSFNNRKRTRFDRNRLNGLNLFNLGMFVCCCCSIFPLPFQWRSFELFN